MNQLNAIGNISKDAVLKYTPKGDAVLEFNFALSSGYGEKKVTTWLNCSVWGKRAETLAPMLLKGSQIRITGEFCARPYTNTQGLDKLSLECRVSDITLLGKKGDSITPPAKDNAPQHQNDDPMDFENDHPFGYENT
jgi:single-strand DNA-binding protein